METTQGQIDGFVSQLPVKCYLPKVASVGGRLKICPWVASRVVSQKSFRGGLVPAELACRGTSHITPLGPYRGPLPRVIGGP